MKEAGVVFQVGLIEGLIKFQRTYESVREENRKVHVVKNIKILSRLHGIYTSVGWTFMDKTIHDFDMARYLSGEVIQVCDGRYVMDKSIADLVI